MRPCMAKPSSDFDDQNTKKQENKFQWGELADDDIVDLELLLPPREVIGPDDKGIKKIIEYKFDNEGRTIRVTTTTRVRKVGESRFSKRALERRLWAKFGDAVHEDVGNRLTVVSTEEIQLERPGQSGEEVRNGGDSLAQAGKGDGLLMICRICGKKGDHWTSKCPPKDTASHQLADASYVPVNNMVARSADQTGNYVPPNMRGKSSERSSSYVNRRNEENAIRVGNLSEDTLEPDLLELFSPFGKVLRAYVVKDFNTGRSRGYGFVNFAHKEDAQKAIDKLNGYGYDNLILEVEWSTSTKLQ